MTIEGRSPVRVAIRVDASPAIGSGHLMRCLTLAGALHARGAEVLLLTRRLPQALEDRAAAIGVQLLRIADPPNPGASPAADALAEGEWPDAHTIAIDEEADARDCLRLLTTTRGVDRLVVDHYGLGARYESLMRASVPWVAVLDDLASRSHDCDLLLDQNLPDRASERYRSLVPPACRLLLGPRYALLRDEFFRARRSRPAPDGRVRTILVSMGGVDAAGMTQRAIDALASLQRDDIRIVVVAGGANPHMATLAEACRQLAGARLVVNPGDLAALVAESDLAIGAAGTSTWERCLLGVPTVLMSVADNQIRVAKALVEAGGAEYLGMMPSAATIAAAVARLLADPARVRDIAAAARRCMAGARPCVRSELVMRVMAGSAPHQLRPFAPCDRAMVLSWRNDPRVRRWMVRDTPVEEGEHAVWFDRALDGEAVLPWVFEAGAQPAGIIYLSDVDWAARSCRWGFYLAPEGASGVGEKMCRLALAEAFAGGELQTIKAEVLTQNDRSLKLHDRLGFRRTGARRVERPSGAAEVITFELSANDWRAAAR